MRIKKSWKLAGVSIVSAAAIITPLVVLFYPVNLNQAMSNYILQFNETVSQNNEKNKYINNLMSKTSKIIDDYRSQPNNHNAELDFWSINMNSKQSAGELNYFDTLNRSLRNINPNFGITNVQRTPQTVQEGFYNRNTELMSFNWSPDYNGIGTWINYMFTDSYSLANMWAPTYIILSEFASTGRSDYTWAPSLYAEFQNKRIPGIAQGANTDLFRSPIDIITWIASKENAGVENGKYVNIVSIDDYYTFIANVIGAWISRNSESDIKKSGNTLDYSNIGEGINYVNWIASKNPNIPFSEDGPKTSTPFLVRKGLYKQENPNNDTNYRDWYIRPSQIGSKNNINIWTPENPFQSSKTPWNPAFSQAPNTSFGSSVWTGLTSWTTIGDSNDDDLKYNDQNFLVSNGIAQDLTDTNVLAALENSFNSNDPKIEFKIRPIPWVDTQGRVVKTGNADMYLSPQDFKSGFQAFIRSINYGVNANNSYFIGLSGIDFDKTINFAANNMRNTSASDQNAFTIFFKDPILTLQDTLDILQKQYFFALPTWHPKVQNIVNDTEFFKVTQLIDGNINTSQQDFSVYYGSGEGTDIKVWNDLYFASPYYISDVSKQAVTFKLNSTYFDAFTDVNTKLQYTNFNIQKDGTRRIQELVRKYGGSYNPSILFEQFKSNEVDFSPILASSLNDVINNFKDNLKYYGVSKLNKANTFGYNLQVYEKFSETEATDQHAAAQNIIIDTDGNPIWNPITRTPLYDIDQYGNYDFKGRTPKLKSRISQSYYDLIVKDYYTPISDGGKSTTIRHTINNSINWVALKSLTSPGVTNSIQYSFMPYGVYTWHDKTDPAIIGQYWDLVANKRYEDLDPNGRFNVKSRMTGNMLWTYDEMLKGIIK